MKFSIMNLWVDNKTERPASGRLAGATAWRLEDGQGGLALSFRHGQAVVLIGYGVGNSGVVGRQEISVAGNRLRNVDVDRLPGGGVQHRELVAGIFDHPAVAVVLGGVRLYEVSTSLQGHQRRWLVAASEHADERAEDRQHDQALPSDAGK